MKTRSMAKILGAVVVLVVVALVAVPFFISADFLKTQLVAQVKKSTGRDLLIEGKTSLSLFPTIAVHAENVTLGNPAGFKSEYFAQIGVLEVGAALQPLLAGDLHITGVKLDAATLNLEKLADGRSNWQFGIPGKTSKKAKAASPENSAANLVLGEVNITNSTVNYSAPGKKPMAISALGLKVSGADGRSPLAVTASASLRDGAVKMQMDMASLKDFQAGKMTRTTVDMYVPSTHIAFSGDASAKNGFSANGKLEAGVLGVPTLLAWASGSEPQASLPTNVALRSTVLVDGINTITMDGVSAEMDDMAASGKIAVNLAGTVPAITGNLGFGVLNLTPMLAPKGGNEPPAAATAADAGWNEAPLDFSGLRALNLDMDITADAIRADQLSLGKTVLGVVMKQGVMKLEVAEAALYGGAVKGALTLDGSGPTAGVGTDLLFTGIQIEPLVEAFTGRSRITGVSDLKLVVRGSGATQRALVSSLSGNGALKVADGAIKGVNLAEFMRHAKKGNLFGTSEKLATDFSTLSASWTMASGVLTNKDFKLASPSLRATGSGTATMPTRSLNYKLVPTLVTSTDAASNVVTGGLTVPLLVTGNWSSPQITPDISGALRDTLKNTDALKQGAKDLGETIKQFTSPKDLKRALFGEKPVAEPAAPATEAPKP